MDGTESDHVTCLKKELLGNLVSWLM